MKTALILASLLTSFTAFARQYIQCNNLDMNSTDVMVVNIHDDAKTGTLFISSGMQNPEDERALFDIVLKEENTESTLFEINHPEQKGMVIIPNPYMGVTSDSFVLELQFSSLNLSFVCFSRLYQ